MLDTFALLLLLWQLLTLGFFVALNGYYSFFTLLALITIPRQLTLASHHHITNLVVGSYYRPISIIVPAYNEELSIVTSITLLLGLKYPEFELVVVNDGSSDKTLQRLIEAFRLVPVPRPFQARLAHEPVINEYVSLMSDQLRVLDKRNGGKSDALNAGLNASRFPLFCCVDADSILEPNALMRAAKLFVEDRRVVATGGVVRILNGCNVVNGKVVDVHAPRKWVERFQAIEYLRGFLVGRSSWSVLNGLLIISGAFGVFRKDVVMAINGYRRTVGEDMDLVVRLHRYCRDQKMPYRVHFLADPVCWTQAPADWHSLLLQRNRWHRGLVETLWHNRGMVGNPRYGLVGMAALPYFVLFEALGPAIEFVGYSGFVVFFFFELVSCEFALLFLGLAVLWGAWLNLGGLMLDNVIFRRYARLKDLLILSVAGLFEFAGYRQVIAVERLIATLTFWRSSWGKPKRQEISNEKRKATY